MAKVWLPKSMARPQGPLVPQEVRDEQTGRKMIVFLPKPEYTESRNHAEDLEGSAKEKAVAQMRAKGPMKPHTVVSRQETGKLLREFNEYLERGKSRSVPNRYTFGWRE